jgi:hypothetical protein
MSSEDMTSFKRDRLQSLRSNLDLSLRNCIEALQVVVHSLTTQFGSQQHTSRKRLPMLKYKLEYRNILLVP